MEENGALVTVWTTGDRFERAGYGSFPVRTKRETPRGTRNFRGKLILVRKREDRIEQMEEDVRGEYRVYQIERIKKNLLGIRDSYRVNVEICIISCYILRSG